MNDAEIGAALGAIVGDARVLPAPDDDPLAGAGRWPARRPWIVRPSSVEEVGETVAYARAERLCVLPRGGGTRALPFAGRGGADVVVETGGLDRVIEHTPEDLVVSVECGLGVRALQRRLAARDQWVPVDAPASPRGTIGGWLASNAFGPLRRGHGTLRDWLIGTTLVRFDGRPVRAGGMVVKNVSGYDLNKLYIGSWGSLGILVSANFKLAPRPVHAGVAVVEAVERARGEAIRRDVEAVAVPLNTAVWQARPRRLLLGLAGERAVVEGRLAVLHRIAAAHGADVSAWLEGDEHDALRDELARLGAPGDPALRVRLHGPAASHTRWMENLEAVQPRPDRESTLLGEGVSWLGWHEAPVDVPALVERLRDIGGRHGVWSTVERQPASGPAADTHAIPGERLALMRGIKRALDPDGTFVDGPLPPESGP